MGMVLKLLFMFDLGNTKNNNSKINPFLFERTFKEFTSKFFSHN